MNVIHGTEKDSEIIYMLQSRRTIMHYIALFLPLKITLNITNAILKQKILLYLLYL